MMDILIHIQDMDNVRTPRGSPVILDLLTGFGVVVQELWRKSREESQRGTIVLLSTGTNVH